MTIQQLFKTAPVTTLLLVSFIGLFIVQVLTGVDANNPSTEALLKWGANALPYTMQEQPWRLVSSAFLHIGLMHLLFNGFAMYFFGQVAEPMFGSAKFLALFLLSAIGGNLLNSYVTWQSLLDGTGQPGLSAGASGGIMGIGAALLIAALFKISVNGMVLNLKSLIFIMGINLVYGFAVPGIDNAGHIGGAITGLIIALSFAIAYRQRLAVTLQNAAIYQNQNLHRYQTTYINQPPSIDSYSARQATDLDTTDSRSDDTYAQSNTGTDAGSDINTAHTSSIPSKTPIKPSFIWQLLPWLAMLLISIGFVWWWQDIHYQILQILKAIE
ncbi:MULTISPECIES: rhomboid family intramembrane serine protease [unclassified Psychrobacter]|uniref:rhomboid family intramembrane serine protease n=1 Tax=unclassified Psychrobacter TaxID=196806 RepID=UPI0018CCA2F9|nr:MULTISPECIES: rhomboid family intramembrane serine protease [unclassified Psychrobacter]MBH0065642.1 rhomboid family intramembrane serine protease [Psychrobacter sp. SZ93C1]MBH0085708.1 rhomboid family intramembrane serine protease [Psychrobacter sp. SCQQ22]